MWVSKRCTWEGTVGVKLVCAINWVLEYDKQYFSWEGDTGNRGQTAKENFGCFLKKGRAVGYQTDWSHHDTIQSIVVIFRKLLLLQMIYS